MSLKIYYTLDNEERCIKPCEFFANRFIGSVACADCNFFINDSYNECWVICKKYTEKLRTNKLKRIVQ